METVMRSAWTPEEIEALRAALDRGATATQAAEMLGMSRTRNSIIGFVHRHGEKYGIRFKSPEAMRRNALAQNEPPPAPSPYKKRFRGKRYQRQTKLVHPQYGKRNETKVKPPSLPRNEMAPVAIGLKRITDLANDECRFSITSHNCKPHEHRFCGAPVANPESREGRLRSYCAHHAERVRGIGSKSEREAHKASSRIDGGPIRLDAAPHRRF